MSIRQTIIEKSPFFKFIRNDFSSFSTEIDALAYAIEGHFRGESHFGAVDGFEQFFVVEETQATLRIFGMAYFLPSSLLPFEVLFQVENGGISYRAFCGSEDEMWGNLSKKKRWAAVYLYATEGYEPQWNWDQPLEGLLRL